MSPGNTGQSILLVAAVVAGLPHGALDHHVARTLFEPRYGRRWPVPFLAAYLGLAGIVLASWWAMPTAMLGVFLALSLLHFGAEDNSVVGAHRWAGQVAHGGLPIVATVLAHPAEVERLFASLAGARGAAVLVAIISGPVAVAWIATWVVTIRYWIRHRDDSRTGLALIEAVAIAGLFIAAPPLVAFSIYFVAAHTPRALRGLNDRSHGGKRAWGDLVSSGLPFTALAIVAGVALWRVLPHGDAAAATVRATFILLSALTVPHMWLAWRQRRHIA